MAFTKNFEVLSTEISSYEKIIQRKVYAEYAHEYQEIKRLASKVQKISETIKFVQKIQVEQITSLNTSKANEESLLKKINLLEAQILDRMKGGPYTMNFGATNQNTIRNTHAESKHPHDFYN